MNTLRQLLLLLFSLILYSTAQAQKKDPGHIGTVKGVVRDSVHNYVLQATTVAVYNAQDSSLINYQLTNNFGEFQLSNLPVGVKLRLITSYAGYKTLVQTLIIAPKDPKLDLKNINMERHEIELKEVVIKAPPPVQMNGDTLEFNADAFKLDKNAVTEDLLRKLPGVTIWGDGDITVNGRKVSSVLVNGKPFFSGVTKIATQNLPKDAVDKIQVYQKLKNQDNPLDSTTEVNIKLKKDNSSGHFGKLGGGYGTNKRYETDVSINSFTSLTQFGIVGAANNINKVANNVSTLMGNSTYKGVGANVTYQPDFSMQGINKPITGGFTYLHDFIPDAGNDKNDRLKADYFIKKNINDNLRNTQTITSLGGDSTQTRQDKGSSRYSNTVQNFTARYDKNIKEKSFYAAIGFNANNSYNHETQQSSISASGQRLQSSNTQENEGYDDAKNFSFETGYNRPGSINGKRSMAFNVGYSFNAGADNNDRVNKTEFVSFNNLTQNKNINRHYTNSGNDVNQSLDLGLGDPIQYLFKNRVALWGVSVKPANNVYVTIHHENNEVEDRDSLSGNFIANPYLTGNSRYTLINDLPSLSFDKRFGKSLVNRYSKSLAINFTALAQFYYQKNTSSQLFQNITQNYKKFVPHASVSYMNNQFGYFQDYYKLNFSVSADYPNMSQLVPLVDSINLYYIQQGNNFLKPTNKKEVSFTMTHVSQRTKNEFNYGLNIGMGIVNNSFADSSNIDYLGRSTHKTININGYKYANAGGDIGKAFKFKNNQLQINMNTSFTLSETPSYINGIKNRSNDFRNNSFLSIYYTYLAGLAINLQEGYSAYRSRQNGASSRLFTYDNQYTKLSASVNCTKKLNISSNIAYNHSISNSSDAINFTIWNANAVYRFMQGNNLELKLSALDLLHQNTSIINFGSNNYITRGTVNVLRQYFMATVSYFPRQFRKKHSATDDE